jgi:hypothetical protein
VCISNSIKGKGEKEFSHIQKHQSNDLAPTTPMIFYFAAFAHGFTLMVENIP